MCGVDRLAHHVAELAGDRHAPRARHLERFDQHDVAAVRSPCEACDDADFWHFFRFFDRVARNAKYFFDLLGVDDPRTLFAVSLATRALPHDGREVALEVAKSRFA